MDVIETDWELVSVNEPDMEIEMEYAMLRLGDTEFVEEIVAELEAMLVMDRDELGRALVERLRLRDPLRLDELDPLVEAVEDAVIRILGDTETLVDEELLNI